MKNRIDSFLPRGAKQLNCRNYRELKLVASCGSLGRKSQKIKVQIWAEDTKF